MEPKHRELMNYLQGNPTGYTREELARRLGTTDRGARQIIEEVVSSGALPIICDRGESGTKEGRYRIAGADEYDRVNDEIREHYNRAMSSLKRAKGLRLAYQQHHEASSMFLTDVGDE